MLLASSAVLAASGMSSVTSSAHRPLLEMSRINLVHLLMVHGVWYAPFYAWLLLASAWATRLPFLWATLPPVVIGIVERIAFNSTHFATMVRTHLLGGPPGSPGDGGTTSGMTMEMLAGHPLVDVVVSPGLWGGLLLAAVFLLAAVRLRRQRGAM